MIPKFANDTVQSSLSYARDIFVANSALMRIAKRHEEVNKLTPHELDQMRAEKKRKKYYASMHFVGFLYEHSPAPNGGC